MNMDDLGGKPTIFGNIHILTAIIQQLGSSYQKPGDEVQLRQALLDWLDVWARRRESKRRDPWRERSKGVPPFFFGIASKSAEQNVGHIFVRTGKISI